MTACQTRFLPMFGVSCSNEPLEARLMSRVCWLLRFPSNTDRNIPDAMTFIHEIISRHPPTSGFWRWWL